MSTVKKDRRKQLLIIGLAIAAFLMADSLMVTVYPASDYGDPRLWNERTDLEMGAGDVLNVQDGDFIVAWLMWNPDYSHKPTDEDFNARLYRADGLWIEDGRDKTIYPVSPSDAIQSSIKWWFDLDQCPQGTFTYYINYFATIDRGVIVDGDSFSFQVTNGEAPSYDDAEIIEAPDDVGFDIGESPSYVQWKFTYDGPCVASITLNDVEVESQTYEASGAYRILGYSVDTSVAGIFELAFTVTPDDPNSPAVSDTASVTIAEPSTDTTTTDTTTTDTTTTDTTTTTTTTEPPPDEPYDWTMVAIVVGLAAAFIAIKPDALKGTLKAVRKKVKI